MVVLHNNFDGGPDGVTITTSNSGQVPGNDPFDIAQGSGTGMVFAYAGVDVNNLNRPTAEYAMVINTGSTNVDAPAVGWSTSLGPQTTLWTRFYLDMTSTAQNNSDSQTLFSALGAVTTPLGGSSLLFNSVSATQRVFMLRNNTTGAISYGLAAPIANKWCRIEMKVVMSTTVGSTELYVYNDPYADTEDYTDYVSQTGQNYQGTTVSYVFLGQILGNQTNGAATYYSNWEVNTTDYPGPAPFRQGLGSPNGNLTNPIAVHMDTM